MRLLVILLASFCILSFSVNGQTSREDLELDANELMATGHTAYCKRALDIFLSLDKRVKGRNPSYKYKAAICYLNTNINKPKAVEFLEAINEEDRGQFKASYHYYLGKAYHYAYKFDDATSQFNEFLGKAKKKDERKPEVLRLIEMCRVAKSMVSNPIAITTRSIGDQVNSIGPEYTPVISADESVLIFTSRREGNIGGKMDLFGNYTAREGEFYEDIYVSYKREDGTWDLPINLGEPINTKGHDAVIGLSPDGQTLFIYKSDSVKWGNIFACTLEGREWSRPVKLPSPINTKNWEGSCSINPDGNELFFASNRPGGFGGKDIYMIRKLPDGTWAEPFNLGPGVNTKEDEDAPYIHVDGKTLYFSSKGHNSMGGFDIFHSKVEDGKATSPQNLGYPVNTTEDDVFFALSADGKRGYYSCTKEGGLGEQDLYVIDMPKTSAAPDAVTLLKGILKTTEGDVASNARIIVTDDTSGELVGVFKPNAVTGKYLIVIPQGKKYTLKIESSGYQSLTENISTELKKGYDELKKNYSLEKL